MGMACQQGKLTPLRTLCSVFLGGGEACKCSNFRDKLFQLAMIFKNVHLEYTSVLYFAGFN